MNMTLPLKPTAKAAYPGLHAASAIACVCTDAAGKLIGEPVLTSSSGTKALDGEALRLAHQFLPLGNAGCARMLFNFE